MGSMYYILHIEFGLNYLKKLETVQNDTQCRHMGSSRN